MLNYSRCPINPAPTYFLYPPPSESIYLTFIVYSVAKHIQTATNKQPATMGLRNITEGGLSTDDSYCESYVHTGNQDFKSSIGSRPVEPALAAARLPRHEWTPSA